MRKSYLVEVARSMMHARGELPQVLWAELVNTAAYVLNRQGQSRVEGKVPYEHGKKPKIHHLVIGSECFAHIKKRKKLNKKAIKGKAMKTMMVIVFGTETKRKGRGT